MAFQGLESSVWAPHNRGGSYRRSKRGYTQGSHTATLLRAAAESSAYHAQPLKYHPPPVKCSPYPVERSLPGGLSTSVWAPQNHHDRQKRPHASKIWSRDNEPAEASEPQESLSLPYEVQHCMMVIIQRICEQGCYDFAKHWIPRTLSKNKWTCPEAVELSTWRQLLPGEVPEEALSVREREKLIFGLKEAVQIRNAATHRHICDNFLIRKAASHAQDLMTTLSDSTRTAKLISLKAELSAWEATMSGSYDAAKQNLLDALREIGERPVDDMDWTPNSVSMQELSEQLAPQAPLAWADHMDLD